MRDLNQILTKINEAIERYEHCKLGLVQDQAEIARDLSVNLHWLTDHRKQAHEAWLSVYLNSKASSSAAKEREADIKVGELYAIRHITTSANKVLDMIRSTISVNKQN
jgi:hypothetical protein